MKGTLLTVIIHSCGYGTVFWQDPTYGSKQIRAVISLERQRWMFQEKLAFWKAAMRSAAASWGWKLSLKLLHNWELKKATRFLSTT